MSDLLHSIRPEPRVSNVSSQSSGFASQISYKSQTSEDGGVRLPTSSLVDGGASEEETELATMGPTSERTVQYPPMPTQYAAPFGHGARYEYMPTRYGTGREGEFVQQSYQQGIGQAQNQTQRAINIADRFRTAPAALQPQVTPYSFGSDEITTSSNMQRVSYNTGAANRSAQAAGFAQNVSYNTGTPTRNAPAAGFARMASYNPGPPARTAQTAGLTQTVSYITGTIARSAPVTGALGNLILPSQAAPLPNWYKKRNMPTLSQAMTGLPLSDRSRDFRVPSHGVVKLSNIPYDASKSQVIAVLGEDARVLHLPEG